MSTPSQPAAGPSNATPTTLKILLIGSSAVGKSSLLLRYSDQMFLPEDETTATLGVDQRVKMIERQGKRWRLAIWDTAGQERFRTLTSSYYRSCVAVAVVYDLTNRTSFEALPSWFAELDTFAGPEVVRVVVANKADQEPARAVTNAEGRTFAESKGATFVEVSAKQGRGVDELFESMVDRILANPELLAPARRGLSVPGGYPGTVKLDDSADSSGWGCRC